MVTRAPYRQTKASGYSPMPVRSAMSAEARHASELLLRTDDPPGDAPLVSVRTAALVDAIRKAVVTGGAPAGEELAARISRRLVIVDKGADLDACRSADVVRLLDAIPVLAPHLPQMEAAMTTVVDDLPFLDHADVAWVSHVLARDGPCFWSDDVFASAGVVVTRWPSTIDVLQPFLKARLDMCRGDTATVGRLVGAVLRVCGGERNDGYVPMLASGVVGDENHMMAWALITSGRVDLVGNFQAAASMALMIATACGATELMLELAKSFDDKDETKPLVQDGLGYYLAMLDLPGLDAYHVHSALKLHHGIRVDMGAMLKKHRFAGTGGVDLVATLVLACGKAQ